MNMNTSAERHRTWCWLAARIPVAQPVTLVMLIAVLLLTACRAKQTVDQPPADVPSYEELAASHNARIDQLHRTYSRGVIELRWTDDRGRHFEQGDMDLWLVLPRHSALKVDKLGHELLWLGSNEQAYWLFDMTGQERVLYVGRHEGAEVMVGRTLDVKPLALIDLMGLGRLPAESNGQQRVSYDAKLDAWVVSATGGGGPVRLYLDRATLLPQRIESPAESGEVAMASTLRRYESVRVPDTPVPAYPRMAQVVEIIGDPTQGQQMTATLFISETTGVFEYRQLERVFDFERLRRGLNPDRVEGDLTYVQNASR